MFHFSLFDAAITDGYRARYTLMLYATLALLLARCHAICYAYAILRCCYADADISHVRYVTWQDAASLRACCYVDNGSPR